ncbi:MULTISPECIES: DUF1294 domain-containing protein [Pseudomonas]|uniref:DUF1294 domain-containing protein n=1 Tax=Pseudomonas lundensis TaxID=86185 RepID=A0A266N710_9PSED|nr:MULTISPECIES: DUF1294 domain-containing protein [Pseudomonas]NMY36388.1 DUF1294 domain-containing protein [Pseudomonas sp. WS 5078]NMY59129.1 DUF1294 domain-containing protein [Pseudomonas sp. WS 5354]OZY58281.1 hypothetical protein CJF39_17055 [Pseudomonas lundensis]
MPERGNGPIRGLKVKLVLFAALCALPVGGAATLFVTGVSRVPLLIYLVMSMLAFGLYWYDKQQAKAGQWRTPEKVLHGVELLGGWPGACVAQQLLRHKTRKVSFQLWFWLIVAVHQAIWIDVLFLKMTLLDL